MLASLRVVIRVVILQFLGTLRAQFRRPSPIEKDDIDIGTQENQYRQRQVSTRRASIGTNRGEHSDFGAKGTLQLRAGLDSATATKGAELKFTKAGDFIDFLYNRMRVKELGAQTISGLRDNVAFAKQTRKATGSGVAENSRRRPSRLEPHARADPQLAEDLSVFDHLLPATVGPGRD